MLASSCTHCKQLGRLAADQSQCCVHCTKGRITHPKSQHAPRQTKQRCSHCCCCTRVYKHQSHRLAGWLHGQPWQATSSGMHSNRHQSWITCASANRCPPGDTITPRSTAGEHGRPYAYTLAPAASPAARHPSGVLAQRTPLLTPQLGNRKQRSLASGPPATATQTSLKPLSQTSWTSKHLHSDLCHILLGLLVVGCLALALLGLPGGGGAWVG